MQMIQLPGDSYKLYRILFQYIQNIPAFTRKPIRHSDMAKEMENQSQWGKICTGDFHHPQKDVSTSNLEQHEDPSSREREVFGTTS